MEKYNSVPKKHDYDCDLSLDEKSLHEIASVYYSNKDNKIIKSKIEKYIIDKIDELVSDGISNAFDLLTIFDPNSKYYKSFCVRLKKTVIPLLDSLDCYTNIFEIKKLWTEFSEFIPMFKQYFKDHFEKIVERMYFSAVGLYYYCINDDKDFNKRRKTINDILCLILKELCDKENVDVSDIDYIGAGMYSSVYQIGNKVIKLGRKRMSATIPENPYIVKPLLRSVFSVDNLPDGEQIFVEVTEKVAKLPTDLSADETNEILYHLYELQRDIGIEWCDINSDNVGVLLKDNIIHWPIELHSNCKQLGLVPCESDITLKAGDYVVLDADLQFTHDEFTRLHPNMDADIENGIVPHSLWRDFYLRYNEEHNKKKVKKGFLGGV